MIDLPTTETWLERNRYLLLTAVLAVAGQIAALIYTVATLHGDIGDLRDKLNESTTIVKARYAEITRWQDALDAQNVGYRLGQLEARATTLNDRLDDMIGTFGNSLDQANGTLTDLDKRLDLLAQRVESLLPQPPRKAEISPFPTLPTVPKPLKVAY